MQSRAFAQQEGRPPDVSPVSCEVIGKSGAQAMKTVNNDEDNTFTDSDSDIDLSVSTSDRITSDTFNKTIINNQGAEIINTTNFNVLKHSDIVNINKPSTLSDTT